MNKEITSNLKRNWKIHLPILLIGIIADQLTKIWAVATFSNDRGGIIYIKTIEIVGELARFKLVYNEGAAFGLQPQNLFSWLDPTFFFGLISVAAIVGLFLFYRSLKDNEKTSQLGIVLIVSGAFGNFIDRLRIQKVVDFIDVDFPDIAVKPFNFLWMEFSGFYMERWPTFNIADSLVCIGVAIIILIPMITGKMKKESTSVTSPAVNES